MICPQCKEAGRLKAALLLVNNGSPLTEAQVEAIRELHCHMHTTFCDCQHRSDSV